jgi:hypothetical protein
MRDGSARVTQSRIRNRPETRVSSALQRRVLAEERTERAHQVTPEPRAVGAGELAGLGRAPGHCFGGPFTPVNDRQDRRTERRRPAEGSLNTRYARLQNEPTGPNDRFVRSAGAAP